MRKSLFSGNRFRTTDQIQRERRFNKSREERLGTDRRWLLAQKRHGPWTTIRELFFPGAQLWQDPVLIGDLDDAGGIDIFPRDRRGGYGCLQLAINIGARNERSSG